MILHGILTSGSTTNEILHKIKSISDHNAQKIPKNVSWKCKHFVNFSECQAIYKERWK